MSDWPIKHSTLVAGLNAAALADKGLTYIGSGGKEDYCSYRALRENALTVLSGLQASGLKQGDFCLLFVDDNRTFLEAFWACILGGIVAVPLSSGVAVELVLKLQRVAEQFDAPWLYTTVRLQERLSQFELERQPCEQNASLQQRTVVAGEIETSADAALADVTPASLAFIQFSSGSTSEPKGVLLSHDNLTTHTRAFASSGEFLPDDIKLSWMPLSHDMGLIGFHIGPVMNNHESLIMRTETFARSPALWMEKISEHGVTISSSPNFGYQHYLRAIAKRPPKTLDLSRLRLIFNGAEPISVVICEEFLQVMADYGLRESAIFTVYGLAEATLAVAFPEPGKKFEYLSVDRHSLQAGKNVKVVERAHEDAVLFVSEGQAIRDSEFQIRNPQGAVLADGQLGGVYIKGPSVTSGYYRVADDRLGARVDGCLDTGDLGFVHCGKLYITGRSKDIIFSNGLNYYPHDLEMLSGMDLGRIAICGVRGPGDSVEEDIICFLKLKPGEELEQLGNVIKASISLGTGLMIKYVLSVNTIPKTTSGKVQRARLAAQYLQGDFAEQIAALSPLVGTVDGSESSRGALAIEIKKICSLHIKEVVLGFDDNFFESGISSLSLAQVHQELDELYPDILDITDFFDYPTIAELSDYLANALKQSQTA